MPDPDSTTPNLASPTFKIPAPIKRQLSRARGLVFGTSLILLIQSAVILALPWPVKFLIDDVLLSGTAGIRIGRSEVVLGTPEAIGAAAVLLFMLAVLNALFDLNQETLVEKTAQRVVEGTRHDLLSALMTRRLSFLDSRRRIDLLGRISGDTAQLETLISSMLLTVFRGLPIMAMALLLVAWVDQSFSLILVSAVPLMYGLARYFSRHSREKMKTLRRESAFFEQDADHTIWALPTIKSLNLEPIALEALLERCRNMAELSVSAERTRGRLTASLHWVKNVLRAIAVLVGGTAVAHGELSLGSLTLLIAYVDIIAKPVHDLADLISNHSRVLPSIERIEDLYEELQGEEEKEGSLNISSLPFPDATDLRFEHVSFAYDRGPLLIEDFSAEFHAGELITVLGPSGAGKSTLGRLMNRLLDPIEGRILLGRTDIRRFRLQLLRKTITLVRHEPFFIEGTVRENLLLGLSTDEAPPDESEISEALHAAAASDVVAGLENKLETVIGGPHAWRLSPDQAKRLHLARAFLRPEARVVIFDHPTTGLDAESAAQILESTRHLTERGAIVFWITHRLEDAVEADRVVFFHDRHPRVGSHDELLAKDVSYRAAFSKTRLGISPEAPRQSGRLRQPSPRLDV